MKTSELMLGSDNLELQSERALVLGGGVGGLAAAAALQSHFNEVVVFERDEIPEYPHPRRGVPQDEQLHNLLSCAQDNLEVLMPGFLDALLEAGASSARVADQTHVHELGVVMPKRDLDMRLMSAWRPVIEHVARQNLITGEGNVTFVGQARATGLTMTSEGAIAGAVIESPQGKSVVEASLIVDATGTGSRAPRWLQALGLTVPVTDTRKVDQWYVSTRFERTPGHRNDNDFWLSFPDPPQTRGGLVSPVGENEWYVSVSGSANDTPPKTAEEVKAFTRTLVDNNAIAALIEDASATSEPNLFRKTTASIRRYDQLDVQLPGFFPIGDAIASLNPLFGQGMSVAAMQANNINIMLTSTDRTKLDIRKFTSDYLDTAVEYAQSAWNLGEMIDQAVLGTINGETVDTKSRFKALASLINEDPQLHKQYVQIWHLLQPVEILHDPNFLTLLDQKARELSDRAQTDE